MEIILTNKNSELLIFKGYAYIKHRTLADNSLSWRCALSSCNGRVRTKEDSVEIVKDHCHFPNPADIEKRKFRKTLKDRAAVSDVTPRQTIFAAQRDVNRETAVHLPSYSANQQAVNRVRREKRPKMAEPTSLTGFELPLALQKTQDGQQFLLHDSSPQDILLEKMCAGQKVARPKKAKYQKLDKNLITMITSYQPYDIIGFLKGCSYNIKL